MIFSIEYYKGIVDKFLILLSAFITESSVFTETKAAVE
jgi:hypothetical protein